MTNNDTNTLNGALQELGETMASNLTAKGVTASASDGLTTLANKILTIQASCYHIEFSEDSYVAVGGSATLEIYLQENYQPKVGANVTVTGSDSSVYSGITNSNGVATVTVTNIAVETTFTCSYNNVSDTATVTVGPSYIYAPTLDGTETWYKINSSYTPTYSTVSGVNQVCDACGYLSDGWDNTINWKLTFEYKYSSGTVSQGALVTFNNVTARDRNSLQFWGHVLINHQGTGGSELFSSQTVCPPNTWNTVEITKNGSSLTIVVNDNTYTCTNTDFSNSSRTRAVIGLDKTGTQITACIRNIKVEAL